MSTTGDRTEKPTAKRIREAREKGQVARSRDLSSAMSFAAATLTLGWFGMRTITALSDRLGHTLQVLGDGPMAGLESTALAGTIWSNLGTLAAVAGPPAAVAGVVSVAASVGQVGWVYAPKAIEFSFAKLSPASGIKRFKPGSSSVELLKSVLSMAAVGAVGYLVVRDIHQQAPRLMSMTPTEAAAYGWERVWSLLWRTSAVFVALAAADFGLQRWRWYSQMRMTRQDVRDETRMHEGNPEIKSRVRRAQREMSRRRMLHAVKRATVVVTNPTHFAVALEYRRTEMVAPLVVAKGQDHMAARIRAVAQKHGVPIVENVTLARTLYKTAEVGDTIPAALFGAVAEVLAYLVRLKQLVL